MKPISTVRAALVLGVVVAPLTAAHGQDAAAPAAQPLFESDAPLELRLAVDLRTLINDRDSLERTEHPAVITYRIGDAAPVSLDVDVRTRGHWRRQRRNCDFPPLRLDLPRGDVGGTEFANQDKLKLVTPCRPGRSEYEEYVLREYLVYEIHNLLTPRSLRARLARITYVDTTGREDSLTTHAFLLEDADAMATRNGGRRLETPGGRFEDMDSVRLGLAAVFLYMIGGTDWSLSGLHNIELMLDEQRHIYYPVPYDFDWTGIVNTSYAVPDRRLRIKSVRDRLYRGPCLSADHWNAVLATFRERKAEIYALYETVPGLSAGYVRDTHRYLDAFYEVIDDPGKFNRELINRCRTREGV